MKEKIELYLKEKYAVKEIAKKLGRQKRTIDREIARGMVYLQNSDLTYRKDYCADVAHRKYGRMERIKGPRLKKDGKKRIYKRVKKIALKKSWISHILHVI